MQFSHKEYQNLTQELRVFFKRNQSTKTLIHQYCHFVSHLNLEGWEQQGYRIKEI